jgi:subtilase family serine protease
MFAASNNSANTLDAANTSLANGTQASVLGSNSDLRSLSTENLFTGTPSSSNDSLPDLIIEDASGPERAKIGDQVTLSYTEKNIGSGNAGKHFVGLYLSIDDKFDSSDKLLGTNSFNRVESLNAGTSIKLTKTFNFDASNITDGNYYLLYVADDFYSIQESNESNNVVAKQIAIQGTSPDLIVKNGDAPETVKAGTNITLYYREENIGKRDAGDHQVGFYLSRDNQWDSTDTLLGYDSVSRLEAGSYISRTKEFTLDENLDSGDYYLLYVGDRNNSVYESDETNNVFAKAITIQYEQANSSHLSFKDTESPIDSTPSVLRDEKNQDLVEREKFASTSSTPDLIVEVENDKSPERAKAGSEISLSYKEKNVGSEKVGEHTVGFYLSKDDQWDSSDTFLGDDSVKGVRPGKYISHTKTFTLDSNITTGDYYLLYVGDNKNNVNESDETNNIVAKAITIQGKDVSQSLNDAKPSIPSTSSLSIDENDEDSLEIEKFASTAYSPHSMGKNTTATATATAIADSETELFYKGKKIGSKR